MFVALQISVNLYIRGSNSRSQLKSVPVSLVIFDELDEMNLNNIDLAEQRTSGQLTKEIWKISTPTVAGRGINKYYVDSTQEKFIFRCPGCSKHISFRFPESLVITGDDSDDPDIQFSHLICTECKYQFKEQFEVPLAQAQLEKKAALLMVIGIQRKYLQSEDSISIKCILPLLDHTM